MEQGLFESLTGTFLDGTPVDAVPKQGRRVLSVMDHLKRMFNSRRGSTATEGDYGLPDISEIYRNMPDGIDWLRSAIRETVERFEPRLEKVDVQPREPADGSGRLEFILSARLRGGGRVTFQTTFTSMGESSIAPYKRVE
jgi:type VI secretion system protein